MSWLLQALVQSAKMASMSQDRLALLATAHALNAQDLSALTAPPAHLASRHPTYLIAAFRSAKKATPSTQSQACASQAQVSTAATFHLMTNVCSAKTTTDSTAVSSAARCVLSNKYLTLQPRHVWTVRHIVSSVHLLRLALLVR